MSPTKSCGKSVPSPCNYNLLADPHFLVVPTGGCWARADFLEVINRTVITKSIVAVDCSDSSTEVGGLSTLIADAANIVARPNANAELSLVLNKLVGCIISNNGVISPSEPVVHAYVIEYNTQKIIAFSDPVIGIQGIPSDFSCKYDVNNVGSKVLQNVVYETYLANPSSWFEFVAPDSLDCTNQRQAYRFVSYAGLNYRLVIQVGLTYNCSVTYPCTAVEECGEDEDDCCESEEEGNGISSLGCWKCAY